MTDKSQLYTVREIADKLTVTERTVYRWIASEKIEYLRHGENGQYRFTEAHINDFLKGKK